MDATKCSEWRCPNVKLHIDGLCRNCYERKKAKEFRESATVHIRKTYDDLPLRPMRQLW